MNKTILSIFTLVVAINFNAQCQITAFNETFDNNKNDWSVTKGDFVLSAGQIIVNSNAQDERVSFPQKKMLLKPDKIKYEISVDMKVNSIANNGRIGFAISNATNSTNDTLLSGYIFYIEKYHDKIFLSCHNIDENAIFESIGFDTFPLSTFFNLKLTIDNNSGTCKLFFDQDLAYSLNGPLFNLTNIGLYKKGVVDGAITEINVAQDEKSNDTYAYDLIDRFYDSNSKSALSYRGRYNFSELLHDVPKILLCDNLFFPKESNLGLDSVMSELMDDLSCTIEKSNYVEASTPNLKYYKLKYKENHIVISYNIDTRYLVSTSIIFESSEAAKKFYNSYIQLKKFKENRNENGTIYSSHPLFLLSFVSLNDRTVNFLY